LERVKRILTEFSLSTSIQAIPGLVRTESVFMKFVWSICFLIAIAGCLFLFHKTVIDYDKYEIVVQNTVIKEKSLKFPAVFICPIVETPLNKLFMQCEYDFNLINCTKYIQMVNVTNEAGQLKACYKINGGNFMPLGV